VGSLDRAAVVEAIKSTKNLSAAARALGCSRRTLQNRMREYGLAPGRSGRPKRKLSYGRRRRAWAIGGAVAAAGLVGALALRKTTT
jgi:hypothetical protein